MTALIIVLGENRVLVFSILEFNWQESNTTLLGYVHSAEMHFFSSPTNVSLFSFVRSKVV